MGRPTSFASRRSRRCQWFRSSDSTSARRSGSSAPDTASPTFVWRCRSRSATGPRTRRSSETMRRTARTAHGASASSTRCPRAIARSWRRARRFRAWLGAALLLPRHPTLTAVTTDERCGTRQTDLITVFAVGARILRQRTTRRPHQNAHSPNRNPTSTASPSPFAPRTRAGTASNVRPFLPRHTLVRHDTPSTGTASHGR